MIDRLFIKKTINKNKDTLLPRRIVAKSKKCANTDMERILNIALDYKISNEECTYLSKKLCRKTAFEEGFRLRKVQAHAYVTFQRHGHGFFQIFVGDGKTLISILLANEGFKKHKKIMLIMPNNILPQLWRIELPFILNSLKISVPIHLCTGNRESRISIAKSDKIGLYIFTYSLLSRQDSHYVLNSINPTLIIFDEAHLIKNHKSAKTKRISRYIKENNTKIVAMSGTITGKSIFEYHHTLTYCLGMGSPLPITKTNTYDWAQILDSSSTNIETGFVDTKPLWNLVDWSNNNLGTNYKKDIIGCRQAYSKRFITTPGIVVSYDDGIKQSLYFINVENKMKENYPGMKKLLQYIKNIKEKMITPNGDEIDHAIHTWKYIYELSAGFYNYMYWPDIEEIYKKVKNTKQANLILNKSKEYLIKQNEFNCEMRKFLDSRHIHGLDTPHLIYIDMINNKGKNVGNLYEGWTYLKSIDFDGRISRKRKAKRICDYKIKKCTEFVKNNAKSGLLIWYKNIEIGKWIYETLKEEGINCTLYGSGHQANEGIINKKNKGTIAIASIGAHHKGKNLQHMWSTQYCLQWPRSASISEQLLGRIHRKGQPDDQVITYTNNNNEFDNLVFSACLNDSFYIQSTTGSKQKLMYGTYMPTPKMFPRHVLKHQGLQTQNLTKGQYDILVKKFGEKK